MAGGVDAEDLGGGVDTEDVGAGASMGAEAASVTGSCLDGVHAVRNTLIQAVVRSFIASP